MKFVKRIGAWLLAVVLIVQLLPMASAANLTSDRAKSYLQIVNNQPDANSYLVDFDGDGADELLITWQSGGEKTEYEVYSASSRVAADSVINEHASLGLYRKSGASGEYIGIDFGIGDSSSLTSFTLSGGKWSQIDNISEGWIGVKQIFKISGKEVSAEEYKKAESAYSQTLSLNHNAPYHSVKSQLVSAIDTSSSNRKDVLSSLTAGDKTALYDRLLCNVLASLSVPGNLDSRTVSDAQLIECLEFMQLNSQFPFADYGGREKIGGIHTIFRKEDFTKLTTELFGRTVDYSKITRTTQPSEYEYSSFMYKNEVYLMNPQMGYSGQDRTQAQYLYELGGSKYYTAFKHWQKYPEEKEQLTGVYGVVVKKNPDNTWTLIRLYPEGYTPTEAELDAYVQPSSWAKAEVEAADAAGLIPILTGDPAYQDTATRLQFAQLTVHYVEKTLGKTLQAAPSGTFTDCKDTAVLKAYQAGLVNGTSDTAFSPGQTLTREQLATMLWRTIVYVQAETGKNVYTKPGSLSGFSDKGQVSAWAVDGTGRLAANGIMKGTSDTSLSPKASCTVEESILLVYRLYTAMQ